jgi:Ca2+-binding EF-hand superfamily protein
MEDQKMKHARIIGSIALVFLTVGAAQARQPAVTRKPPVPFTSIDTNADGQITRDEVRYMDDLNGAFGSLDANADQKLTQGEFLKWGRAARTGEARADEMVAKTPRAK